MNLRENKVPGMIQEADRLKWTVHSNHNVRCFTKREIEILTNNFSTVIGRGAFGEVFQGILEDTSIVAVKRFVHNVKENFAKELTVYSEINHKNVVKLMGYCVDESALMMVTEYIPNGNLSNVLHEQISTPIPLDIRLRIATECAEALAYMHSHMYTQVIHGDIKPDNILLDGSFNAKISDFGISRLVNTDTTLYTKTVIGSIGYMDPLFARDGLLTVKSDVYSFGVVILELITRKRATTKVGQGSFIDLCTAALSRGIRGVREMLDVEITGQNNMKTLEGIAKLARECLRMERDSRPEMIDVVVRLRMLAKALRQGQERIDLFFWARKSKPSPPALVTIPAAPAQTETTSAVEVASTPESQPTEDLQVTRFTWTIENFTRLNLKKLYSDVFVIGGYKWRVLIFPKGNNVDQLSMYLDVADSANLPNNWSRYAQFSLTVISQIQPKYSIRKETQHQFTARESDWGFTSFMPLVELYGQSRGYLVNDTFVVEAEVALCRMDDYWTSDSKKETGYVGLKNQGATGYINSLLQTLYHIPYFRKAVYHMPTTENDMPFGSITLALQSIFYKLQYNDSSVATKELTKSFGWDTHDSSMQHDVQELNRILCEKLEDNMKGTVVEGTIGKLFEGHNINYIECINVDCKSRRKESFYDLQLDVKGCHDVYSSFDKYVEVERLEGDDKYHAENHGLQDAKKGVLFLDVPPVLQLHLKRFEYNYVTDTMVKINDRYEYPLQLDLDKDGGKYLSPDADRSTRNLYTLHSVLVHSDEAPGGHYYAFIRPTLSRQWYKFDDECVTKEDPKKALEEQYGGEEENSNAYMLVYIRENDMEKIMCTVDEKDIAEHLRIRLKKDQEEKKHKKKEKAEARLYTIIKVARDEDLKEQIGKNTYFDLVDHDKVRSFRIQKQLPFSSFKEEVAKEYGIPVQFQRFWFWAKRQNHTYRPNRPLTPHEETQSVGQLREVSNKAHNAELKLFLEVDLGLDLRPLAPPEKCKEDILLFFKLYDPEREQLRFVGRLFVKALGKPLEILAKLNEMAGLPPNEDIEIYEEIKFEPIVMCEVIDKKRPFRFSQLEDGDIICFQRSPKACLETQVRYLDVPSFLEYVHNRQVVHFRSLEKPKEEDFSLELSKLHTYDDVVEKVARQLGLDDPAKIRLTSHNCYSQQPKPQPVKYRGVDHLLDMLIHYNQTSDILYYEVLDIPLPELQFLKTLKVAFHHAATAKDEVIIHSIRLPKNSTIADVISELKTKVELSNPNADLRLLEVFYHKIYKIFSLHEKIENINDQYWTLRAEEIPDEEKNISPNDRLIHVYHFMKDPTQNQQIQNTGDPFLLLVHEGETLAEVKKRIQNKLQVPDEEFSKWKFAFISMNRPDYLQDSDVVPARFQRRDVYGAWEQYLGLEHTDTTPKKGLYSESVNQAL